MAASLNKLERDEALQPEKLLNRFRKLLETRRLWEPTWQEISDYVLPQRNDVIVRKSPGQRRTEKLFDSTAIFAAELLAAAIHGTLTSSYIRWFSLQLDDEELNEDQEIGEWLDACAQRMYLALNQSNFAQEVHEMYSNLVPFGTGYLLEEEKKERNGQLIFKSIRLQDAALAEDADGRVNTVFRSIPMTRGAILEKWPNAKKAQDVDLESDPDMMEEVIHAVVPASDKRFKFAGVYLLSKSKYRLEVKGYYEFPFMVPRWSKETGETYGRGRGHTALPDIKTCNKMVEMELRALGKVVNPPVKARGGDVIGQVKLNAGGVSTVRDMESLAPLFPNFDYQPVNLKIQDLKQTIRQMFYSDQLQLSNQSPQMTATEVNVRYEQMQRILGPTLGRLESELLDPMIARTFKILLRANKLPPIPAKLQQAQTSLNVRYEGPLARSQQSSDVAAVQQLEQVLEPLMQTHPEIADVLDLDGLTRHTAIVLGIPKKYVRDDQGVGEIRQQRQQAQQAQENQQATLTAATAAGNAAPMLKAMHSAPEQGSIADQMQQQQNQGQQ